MTPLIQINLYNIPPQPRKVQEWTIVQGLFKNNLFFVYFSFCNINLIVDSDNVLAPYPYPSDPMIAEQFYEEYSSNNKNKPTETEPGKGKVEEKVKKKLIILI